MKKIILVFILYFINIIVKCQTFSAAFDPWDYDLNQGNGFSYESNVQSNISDQQPDLLESYLQMFKATKDMRYLEKFVIQSTRVMERRDDYLGYANNGIYNYYLGLSSSNNGLFGYPYNDQGNCNYVTNINGLMGSEYIFLNPRACNCDLCCSYSFEGRSMNWSMDVSDGDISCVQFYQPAMNLLICTEMAEFCYYLYADPDFNGVADKNVPQEVQNITNEHYIPAYDDWSYPFSTSCQLTTYADFANWLYFHICQVDQYILGTCGWSSANIYSPRNSTWYSEDGTNQHPNFLDGNGGIAQFNQQCFLGRTLLYMFFYETGILGIDDQGTVGAYHKIGAPAPSCMGDLPGGFDFLGRTQEIGQLVKDGLQWNSGDAGYPNSFSAYAILTSPLHNSDNDEDYSDLTPGNPEDFVHAHSIFSFADLCYRFKINKLNTTNNPIFTLQDMQFIANDFARDMSISPVVYLPANSLTEGDGRWSLDNCGLNSIEGGANYSIGANTPITGEYVFLSAYNPYIYSEILNDWSYSALYNPTGYPNPNFIYGAPNGTPFSNLALYENANIYDANGPNSYGIFNYSTIKNIFNPVAVYPDVNASEYNNNQSYATYTPIQWSSAASGNYDGPSNTTDLEFVSSILNTKSFWMSAIQTTYTNTINFEAVEGTANLSGNIINLASGDYGGTGTTDYVAATDGNYLDIDKRGISGFESILTSGPFQIPSNLNFDGWTTMASIKCPDGSPGDAILILGNSPNSASAGLIYEYNYGTPITWTNNPSHPFYNFLDGSSITTGYFGGPNEPQEVAIVDVEGNISIYSLSNFNNTLHTFDAVQEKVYFTQHANQQVNGITSGNFDGSGYDQIVLHSAVDGCFKIYKYKASLSNIDTVGYQAFPDGTTSQTEMPDWQSPNYFLPSQWWQMGVMTSIKNFPGSPGDALATFRNCDGRIMVFDMQGVCEGQNVSGDYFVNTLPTDNPNTPPNSPPNPANASPYNCSTVVSVSNNPYSDFINTTDNTTNNSPLDYQANNVLTASNDYVSSGTTVNFKAGNKIVLNPGFAAISGSNFDAKIDPSISCGANQYFHKPLHHKPPTGIVFAPLANSKPYQIDSLNVRSKPSPTNGQISVNVIHIDSTDIGQEAEVYVCNMIGQKVFQGNMVVEKDNNFPINLATNANGVYLIVVKTKNKVYHGKVILQH